MFVIILFHITIFSHVNQSFRIAKHLSIKTPNAGLCWNLSASARGGTKNSGHTLVCAHKGGCLTHNYQVSFTDKNNNNNNTILQAVPLRHAGANGERKYSSHLFLTWTLDGLSDQCHATPRFTPRKGLAVPVGEEAGWVSELVWTQRLEEKPFACTGDQTPVVQSVARDLLTELPQFLVVVVVVVRINFLGQICFCIFLFNHS
jgi:hypothetical protein